jgi:cytochrome c556
MVRPSISSTALVSALACSVVLFVSVGAQQPPAAPASQQPGQPPAQQPSGQRQPDQPAGRGGQRGGRGGETAGQPPAAPAAKPLVPVATNTVNANPDVYYGQGVTITAAVEQVLSKSAFAVDQRRVAGAPAPTKPTDVLVLVPTLQSPVDPKSYVTVMGELVKFDPAEVAKKAKDYKLDLPPDALAKYNGRPALIATSVITDKFVDLAKRLPPPMTADEETLSKVMKQFPPALAALRTAVDGSKAEDANKQAAVLRQGFADTEAFWKPKKPDATQWAHDARVKVEGIQAAIAAGKWEDAKAAVPAVQQVCGTCHNVYRDRFDDGSFRIKIGGGGN